ncbi:tRNA (adenosine(37)-N6)-threonylcarbamoyltransferase complex ATPase subunit type 1 TsaE [Collinsella sp. zg1085]|uniref:tRNA (adenosine(37)-N6)-threonylcarbamoyltransferase complex ATPase subunit type 1 TsaE n=1 Tax=Collinsella sp. zg1085 TaxID=2844380 RepID=UPI001C0CC47E|nr:tRNA (adenosine(37)-N6)-threonylcarbamoyltransferase complex ATPase subunit type 1 TsaE [Collinsella sp. zg1085]QWT17712.1 tRNA (adenosine(37)-N6)-threonylcarbamoyltransferase complex ATPase subunit type 1 TsaE [Collinsella sp. zg1085]
MTYLFQNEAVTSYEAADTEKLGELIAPKLRDGDVLVLSGGLGAGKTHFTKGVARGLGDTVPVTSPTFALMAVHDQGRIPLFHFDLYRLEHAYELEDTGIFDVLGYEGVCLLEWGEQFQDELSDEFLRVVIEKTAEGARRIYFDAVGARPKQLRQQILDTLEQENGASASE